MKKICAATIKLATISIIISMGLSSCSVYDSTTRKIATSITPYRIDVIQGQAITKEQISLVKVGMTRDEIKLILGSPSIDSIFDKNRWDYIFFYRNGFSDVVKKRQVTLTFERDILQNIKADALPSELELIKEIDKNK